MNKKSFTLLEVLVSVVLVFIIGMTLTKVSSQNTNTLYSVKNDMSFLYSAVVNSPHQYKDINDYIAFQDTPKYDLKVQKKEEIIGETVLPITETFFLNYILKKEQILSENNNDKAYFRIK